MATDNKDFLKQQTDSSRVKATIISEYFPSYRKIIGRHHVPKKFGYYDMFAGPGMYEDGGLNGGKVDCLQLTERQRAIIELIKENPFLTAKAISEKISEKASEKTS